MAWHYRDCDLGHGAWQAKQLHVSLLQLSKRLPISVYAGDKVCVYVCVRFFCSCWMGAGAGDICFTIIVSTPPLPPTPAPAPNQYASSENV